ncbi:MAG: type IV secretion system protein [Hyphomonadaceae bacterium]|nr:type IV secretion system protein [Hyphomonadaceae bacterium]
MSRDLERRFPAADDEARGLAQPNPMQNVALDFAEETVREAQRGRKWAWRAVFVLLLVCAAQAAAIALLLPLRDVSPYTILVDRQTGYMEIARGVETGGELSQDQALVHAFLAQYVLQRETFDPADFQERYRRVAIWSADQARADYVALYQGEANSLLASVRPGTVIAVTVKNIELLSDSSARVRYELTRRDPGAEPQRADWQALIGFRFTGAPMRMADRLINPLGFQVTHYRRDPEWTPGEAALSGVISPGFAPARAESPPERESAKADADAEAAREGPSP